VRAVRSIAPILVVRHGGGWRVPPFRWGERLQKALSLLAWGLLHRGGAGGRKAYAAGSAPDSLLERMRLAMALRHYSPKMVEAYVGWVRRFVVFHRSRHSQSLGAHDVQGFLTHLARVVDSSFSIFEFSASVYSTTRVTRSSMVSAVAPDRLAMATAAAHGDVGVFALRHGPVAEHPPQDGTDQEHPGAVAVLGEKARHISDVLDHVSLRLVGHC
jgi:hypothetical protein